VKRQPGLSGVESVREVADASLAQTKAVQDGESRPVRQGMKQPGGAFKVEFSARGHGLNVSTFADVSRELVVNRQLLPRPPQAGA